MDIRELIKQNENAKLDFKREWYWEATTSKQDIQKKKLELYKDLIAMTNGNVHYIGKPTYLIIGVKEAIPNEIHHVDFNVMALQQEIIQNVNNYATPLIQDLTITKYTLDGKDVYVIEIPPHPFPIILKQDLKGLEKKGTLLIRAGEGTVVVDGADYDTRKVFEEAFERVYGKKEENLSKEEFGISLAWHEDVVDILKIISNKYYIHIEKDWYKEENLFLSKYSQQNIAIFCTLYEPDIATIKEKIAFSQKYHKGSLDKFIIAVKNGDDEFFETIINGVRVEYRYKNELLDSLVDFHEYFEYIKEEFEEKEISYGDKLTLRDIYTKSRGEIRAFDEKIKDRAIVSVEDYLLAWTELKSHKQISLLGEYGQGKSVLSLKLAYEMIKNNYSRIPIIIELRGKSPRNEQIEDIVSSWARKFRIAPLGVMRLIHEGKVLIILEGFDEIDMIGDSNRRLEHFNRLWEFAEYEHSKVIITGRPNMFLDDEEMKDYLKIYKNDEYLSASEAIHIKPFNYNEITDALRNVSQSIKTEMLHFLISADEINHSIKDLLSRPSTLYQASVIWDKLDKKNINSALVIENFLNHAYIRQEEKLRTIGKKGVDPLLTTNERKYFTLGIAVAMVEKFGYTNQINGKDLEKIVKKLYDNISNKVSSDRALQVRMADNKEAIASILNDIQTSTILVRDYSQSDSFKFAHMSFLEYLTAKYFFELRLRNMKSTLLDKKYKYYIEGIEKGYKLKVGEFIITNSSSIFFVLDMLDEVNINCKKFFNTFSFLDKLMMYFSEKIVLLSNVLIFLGILLLLGFVIVFFVLLLPYKPFMPYVELLTYLLLIDSVAVVSLVSIVFLIACFDKQVSLYLAIKDLCSRK